MTDVMTEPKTGPRGRLRTGLLAIAAATAMTVSGLAVGASPASAAGNNGSCEIFELCLWYGPNLTGSMLDMANSSTPDPNYGAWDDVSHYNDLFRTAGSGRGTRVINNAASARNADPLVRVTLYSNKFCSGTPFVIQPNATATSLGSMQNNNESHCWF